MSDTFLSQEEIDALLQRHNEPASKGLELSAMELDALGEIANISMGSAATALSLLLQKKVVITTPQVRIATISELSRGFSASFLAAEINFTLGLTGANILIIKISDAAIIADLMMGGPGRISEDIDEIQTSAIAEAMNQMIGSAATSMSTMFERGVAISPPLVQKISQEESGTIFSWDQNEKIVIISFRMQIGDLIDSEFFQVIPLDVAREEAGFLLGPQEPNNPVPEPEPDFSLPIPSMEEIEQPVSSLPKSGGNRNLELILDVPLQVSVVLGRTRRPLKEVLSLTRGSVMELEKLADEPVEILVNGMLIARGEVVVISERFGVRITSILSPEERVGYLRK